MPRPKTKAELLEISAANLDRLFSFCDNLPTSDQSKSFPKEYMNRNIRDVFGHLHAWHLLFFDWYTIGMKGEKPKMPAPGYTWKTTSDLNKSIQKEYSKTSLAEIKKKLKQSHKKIMKIIESHTNDDLFTKKKYGWTGSTSLGAYLVSSTSSHYDWAYKLIKKALK